MEVGKEKADPYQDEECREVISTAWNSEQGQDFG